MKMGTKSVLFGAHCFLFHWIFVAWGWWKLHRFRRIYIGVRERPDGWKTGEYASLWRPALWVAFFVHDLGYLGKPNMDGDEGEQHPRFGAAIMRRLFGEPWGKFVLYHSRFLAKQHGEPFSALCVADKYAIVLTPRWLYLPMVNWTGEIREYMAKSSAMNNTGNKYSGMNLDVSSQRAWHADCCRYVRAWIEEHKDGRPDTWTPNTKQAITDTGVWK